MNPIETIYIDNVATDVEVINGVFKFPYNVGQELTAIRFVGTTANNTITSINLKKADLFASISHLDYCFMNCTALTQIDFGKKSFGSLQHAVDAFKGCTELTTIKIDASSEWAPDVDLSDCPLTKASVWQFVNALKTYTSGLHHIIVSDDTWDSLTTAEKSELEDTCEVKYWSIHAPYHIRGTVTSGTTSITLRINNTYVVVPCVNDAFDYEYQKPITSLSGFIQNNTTITSIDFSDADDLLEVVNISSAFAATTALTTINFSTCTLENVTNAVSAFNSALALTSVNLSNATFSKLTNGQNMFTTAGLTSLSLPEATFESLTNGYQMINNCQSMTTLSLPKADFGNVQNALGLLGNNQNLTSVTLKSGQRFQNATNVAQMFFYWKNISDFSFLAVDAFPSAEDFTQTFYNCKALTSITLDATFANATTANNMFNGCSNLTSINLSSATFANLASAENMFVSCTSLTTLDLSAATFANLINGRFMFNVLTALQTLNLPNATFEKVTDATGIFSQYNGAQLTTINVPKATFESLSSTSHANFFNGNFGNSIVNYTAKPLGVDNKAISVSFAFYAPRLNYTSYLSVANWLKDLSGLTAQTITISSVAWNALTTAQQNEIDAIISGKNWTRVLA